MVADLLGNIRKTVYLYKGFETFLPFHHSKMVKFRCLQAPLGVPNCSNYLMIINIKNYRGFSKFVARNLPAKGY